MAGVEKDGVLDLEKIGAEVESLQESLREYRAVAERVVTNEELLSLSKKARERTLYKDHA